MTGLDALRQRGWSAGAAAERSPCYAWALADKPDTPWGTENSHDDLAVAEQMAVAAALVAEGHDFFAIIRDAREWLPDVGDPKRSEDNRALADLYLRIDAVLAAARGGS